MQPPLRCLNVTSDLTAQGFRKRYAESEETKLPAFKKQASTFECIWPLGGIASVLRRIVRLTDLPGLIDHAAHGVLAMPSRRKFFLHREKREPRRDCAKHLTKSRESLLAKREIRRV